MSGGTGTTAATGLGGGTSGGGTATTGGAAAQGTTGAAAANPLLPDPRVGVGNSQQDNPWWTGGSNVIALRSVHPKSIITYHPQGDLRSQDCLF